MIDSRLERDISSVGSIVRRRLTQRDRSDSKVSIGKISCGCVMVRRGSEDEIDVLLTNEVTISDKRLKQRNLLRCPNSVACTAARNSFSCLRKKEEKKEKERR